jgi:3-methyladenine DNA glycosylase AlkD
MLPAVELDEALRELRALARPGGVEGLARYGIRPARPLGVRVTDLRRLARRIRTDHALALALWDTGIHEARILASIVADPAVMTPELMDDWITGFDAWDVCDQACMNLFDRTPHAAAKALEWSRRAAEFEKRAGFALMAALAVHAKAMPDDEFAPFLEAIERESDDDRNFVKKAVNWALRQIGKRNPQLRERAIETAQGIAARGTRPARWIARDALRELR